MTEMSRLAPPRAWASHIPAARVFRAMASPHTANLEVGAMTHRRAGEPWLSWYSIRP